MKDKKKTGRPSQYKPEYNDQVYKLCLLGATDKETASIFNVSEQTLNAWKQKYPEFLESLKKGKEYADQNVAERLYQRAMGYSHPEEKIFCDKGEIVRADTTKHYPPEVTAAIFWLKNRQKEQWRDKKEIEQSGDFKITVVARYNDKDEPKDP